MVDVLFRLFRQVHTSSFLFQMIEISKFKVFFWSSAQAFQQMKCYTASPSFTLNLQTSRSLMSHPVTFSPCHPSTYLWCNKFGPPWVRFVTAQIRTNSYRFYSIAVNWYDHVPYWPRGHASAGFCAYFQHISALQSNTFEKKQPLLFHNSTCHTHIGCTWIGTNTAFVLHARGRPQLCVSCIS